jgi:hypothetical protein
MTKLAILGPAPPPFSPKASFRISKAARTILYSPWEASRVILSLRPGSGGGTLASIADWWVGWRAICVYPAVRGMHYISPSSVKLQRDKDAHRDRVCLGMVYVGAPGAYVGAGSLRGSRELMWEPGAYVGAGSLCGSREPGAGSLCGSREPEAGSREPGAGVAEQLALWN